MTDNEAKNIYEILKSDASKDISTKKFLEKMLKHFDPQQGRFYSPSDQASFSVEYNTWTANHAAKDEKKSIDQAPGAYSQAWLANKKSNY